MKQKFPLVFIMWKDAESDVEWAGIDNVKKWASRDCIINEIGWLVCETKKYVVLCNQIGEDGDLGNRTKIPTGWILKKVKVNFKYKGK